MNAAAPKEWHILYTEPKGEEGVALALSKSGVPVFLPKIKRDRVLRHTRKYKTPKYKTVEAVMFPRYVFAAADRIDLSEVDGVNGVLRRDGKWARISNDVIEDLRVAIDLGLFDSTRDKKAIFKPGQDVVIEEGPFAGLGAKVKKALSGQDAEILVDLLGRSTLVRVDLDLIKAA
ncbi:transcriptional antiterminator [Terrihabitans soli]|uniref:Transcriptional antiterminator n=1 Tax=Terrihabitans soli TaxID=708113 RepID=A0A6S6QSS5_9HYPH|nr:transcription termination/antitermination NusG family protein [Terrihabitans soli]BCJ90322.1 transcriptional antiterminator [Terrihabitans soli]